MIESSESLMYPSLFKNTIQEEKTTVDVAVLQNDIEALKEKIAMAKEFDSSDVEEDVEDL